MEKSPLSETGTPIESPAANESSGQPVPHHKTESSGAGAVDEKIRMEEDSKSENANCWDRNRVCVWLFIVILILVSVIAGYQFWAKLTFRSP